MIRQVVASPHPLLARKGAPLARHPPSLAVASAQPRPSTLHRSVQVTITMPVELNAIAQKAKQMSPSPRTKTDTDVKHVINVGYLDPATSDIDARCSMEMGSSYVSKLLASMTIEKEVHKLFVHCGRRAA